MRRGLAMATLVVMLVGLAAPARGDVLLAISLRGIGHAEAKKPPRRTVQLFPRRTMVDPVSGVIWQVKSDPSEMPPTGIPMGDDRDWRVQAAQVGVMAAAFTALVLLCGNTRCMNAMR